MNVYVSKATKTLVTAATPQLLQLFPEAKKLQHPQQGELLVINHGLAEYVLLRRLGYHVPNPILCYYDWAGGTPFQVQKITTSMLTANARGFVLNEMGTGKTRTALWSWDALYKDGYCKKLLIVAPLSTLRFTWASEVFSTLPHRTCAVLHGPKKKRLEALNSDADIFIINHDGIGVVMKELYAKIASGEINVLVVDELAIYRNRNPRSEQMRKLADKFDWVWGMTGAPMPHEPTDVWQQSRIVTPWRVPVHKTGARDMMMRRAMNSDMWVPKDTAIDLAYEWMQPAVRFSMQDVTELPETVTREIVVPMGPKQTIVYNTLAKHFQAGVENHVITAANAAVVMGKLLQVAAGWVYAKNHDVVRLDGDQRLETLHDLIVSNSRKVIVFAGYRHTVEGIHAYLEKHGIDACMIHGDTKHRDDIFNAFQNTNKYKAMVAHPECMAHGITLTAANMVVWYGPLTSYDIYEQACARIRRTGQAYRQQIIHLLGSPVERRIYRLLKNRAVSQEELLALFADATLKAQEVL